MCLISLGQTTLQTALKNELSPVPTSLFQDSGDMKFAKTKSVLKANLEVQVSRRINSSKGAAIIDGNAILWCLDWPKECVLSHLAEKLCEYIEKKLMYNGVYLVFDRYKKFSIKGSTRQIW